MKNINCDCLIGFLSGAQVNKSNIYLNACDIAKSQQSLKKYGLLKKEPLTEKEIVDGRKGYLSRFIYCPYCGEKINWKFMLQQF
jgi:hypothetical protein